MTTTASPNQDPDIRQRLQAFMEDFHKGTTTHLMPFLRFWNDNVTFEVKPFDGKIMLAFIGALDQGRGDGSRALDWIVALARSHDVVLRGKVERRGDTGLTTQQLRQWYARHGFQVSRDGTIVMDPAADAQAQAKRARTARRAAVALSNEGPAAPGARP